MDFKSKRFVIEFSWNNILSPRMRTTKLNLTALLCTESAVLKDDSNFKILYIT